MLYYYALNGEQKGPVEEDQLVALGVTRNTLVWCEGMEAWEQAGQVKALQYLFDGGSATPPPSPQPQPQPQQQETYVLRQQPAMPKTWQTEALLVTLVSFLCCSNLISGVLGIVAIVKAGGVTSAYRMGDYGMAEEASREAGRLTKIAFWVSVGWVLLLLCLIVFFAGAELALLAPFAPEL